MRQFHLDRYTKVSAKPFRGFICFYKYVLAVTIYLYELTHITIVFFFDIGKKGSDQDKTPQNVESDHEFNILITDIFVFLFEIE